MLVFSNQRKCATRLVVFEIYRPTKIEWEKIKVSLVEVRFKVDDIKMSL